ncbi:MAG: peptide deformylase [Gemmatimonadetes bacterium]|nr:peptide deformylase [Gemmatimonadota bacterium]
MPLLKIETLGSDVLRRRADEIAAPGSDAELDKLIDDMFETMYDARGIGLAAPQIGLSKRLIVVDVQDESGKDTGPFALFNPVILESGSDTEKQEEGCLSIPGVTGMVERPYTVVVEGQDRQGNAMRIEADAMLARCLQHEIDHLDGVLFIDRMSPLKRNMLLRKYRKQAGQDK